MRIVQVALQGARNLQAQELRFAPGVNWLVGPNGAGKSSVLECVGLLTTSRAFRTAEVAPFVQHKAESAVVSGLVDCGEEPVRVGVARQRSGATTVKWGGGLLARASDLAARLPTYIVDAGLIHRLYLGATGRRALLDWGAFHVEPKFAEHAREWRHVHEQRTAALKTASDLHQLDFWDARLATSGEALEDARSRYVAMWLDHTKRLAARLLDAQVTIDYRPGWNRTLGLAEALAKHRDSDLRTGRTSVGPHKTDLRLSTPVATAREALSRGQQKALAFALVLSQLTLRCGLGGTRPIALIDDLTAELDFERARAVIHLLRDLDVQTFCAAIDLPEALVVSGSDAVFRLDSGRAYAQPERASGALD